MIGKYIPPECLRIGRCSKCKELSAEIVVGKGICASCLALVEKKKKSDNHKSKLRL